MSKPATVAATAADDPILIKRERIGRLVALGLRVGYGLFALAIALFFAGLATGERSITSALVVVCLALGSLVLAPAIVFKYAVKAAYRADREDSW